MNSYWALAICLLTCSSLLSIICLFYSALSAFLCFYSSFLFISAWLKHSRLKIELSSLVNFSNLICSLLVTLWLSYCSPYSSTFLFLSSCSKAWSSLLYIVLNLRARPCSYNSALFISLYSMNSSISFLLGLTFIIMGSNYY